LHFSTEFLNTGANEDVEMHESLVDEESDYLSTDVVDNCSLDVEERTHRRIDEKVRE
jgi:hypothetical protein